MKKHNDFDILENADDNTIDMLSEVPALTNREKKRILTASKKKLASRQKKSGIQQYTPACEVSGVDVYKRPKWHIFAGLAACLVLTGSITATMLALNKNNKAPTKQSPTTPAAVTSQSTETTSETTTNVLNNANAEDSQRQVIAKELVEKMHELDSISRGAIVEVDMDNVKTVDGTEEDPSPMTYYKVIDERFHTMDDVKNFVADFLTDQQYTQVITHMIDTPFSSYLFREIDGELYFRSYKDFEFRASDMVHEIIGEPEITFSIENEFRFKIDTSLNGKQQITTGIAVLVDGKWKLSEYNITDGNDQATATQTSSYNDGSNNSDLWFTKGVYSCQEDDQITCYYVFYDDYSGEILDAEEGMGAGFGCEQSKDTVMFHISVASDNTPMEMSRDSYGNIIGNLNGNTMVFKLLEGVAPNEFDPKTYSDNEHSDSDFDSDPYEGFYFDEVSQRASLEIRKSDSYDNNYTYDVTIRWSSSASETTEWTFSGQFSGRGVLNYNNCTSTHYVYDSETSKPTETIDYSNGTGYLSISERGDATGFVWNDDTFGNSTSCFFIEESRD